MSWGYSLDFLASDFSLKCLNFVAVNAKFRSDLLILYIDLYLGNLSMLPIGLQSLKGFQRLDSCFLLVGEFATAKQLCKKRKQLP